MNALATGVLIYPGTFSAVTTTAIWSQSQLFSFRDLLRVCGSYLE